MAMQTIETGVFLDKIPYLRVGNSENPILVLNGGQAFMRRSDPRTTGRDARRISRLLPKGASFVLLGYDERPRANHSLKDILCDVATIVRTRWSAPITLIGLSYGGPVAVRLAALQPTLVSHLILMASAHQFSAAGHARIQEQIEYAQKGDLQGLVGSFAAIFRRPWLNGLLRLRLRIQRNVLDRKINDREVIIRSLRTMVGVDYLPVRFDAISAKTLIVGGSHDQFFGNGMMEETAKLVPGAELALLENETHMAPIERSRDIAKIVSHFLQY